jgi:hypothetical protein
VELEVSVQGLGDPCCQLNPDIVLAWRHRSSSLLPAPIAKVSPQSTDAQGY